jgi:hypothetical protein
MPPSKVEDELAQAIQAIVVITLTLEQRILALEERVRLLENNENLTR